MRAALLLFLILPASAAGFDIDAPGFWSKIYAIPRTYCERHISLSSPRADKLVQAAAPCEFVVANGRASADCRMPAKQAEKTVLALRRMGTLLSYSQTCDPAPAYPELYYKRDNLTRENAALGLPRADLPAVSGLMNAQLSTLSRLLADHEAALETVLAVDILDPESTAKAVVVVPGVKHKKAVKRAVKKLSRAGDSLAAPGNWARQSRPACMQINPVSAVYAKTGGPADTKLLESIRRLGEPYADAACPLLQQGLAAAVYSAKPASEVIRALSELSNLRSLNKHERGDPNGLVPDDRRFDALSSELQEHRAELERTPHIRALTAAEIERVRESAAQLKKLRAGSLILVRFGD